MDRLLVVWKRFSESVAVVAFAAMFAGFVIGVTARYGFNAPISSFKGSTTPSRSSKLHRAPTSDLRDTARS